jgi:hypothetical protein
MAGGNSRGAEALVDAAQRKKGGGNAWWCYLDEEAKMNLVAVMVAVMDSWQARAVLVQDKEQKWQCQSAWNHGEVKRTLTLKLALHTMLCIALVFIWKSKTRIYTCIRGGEYTKNPLEKYNNRKP